MGGEDAHAPVLLREVLEALRPRAGGIYVDCTFGRGGHAQALLQRAGARGRVIALDRDPAAVAAGRALAASEARLALVQAPFSALARVVREQGVQSRVDGVLFDLGVSSPQLDEPRRGFSFRRHGPLDMRMDPAAPTTAAAWLARAPEEEIAQVLRRYGEERYARRIARRIVRERRERRIETTTQLRDLVAAAVPSRERDRHPATRSFQAIRIFINRELEELEAALPQALDALAPGGRLAVISFHSLEDRLVKRFMRGRARAPQAPPGLPLRAAETPPPELRVLGRPRRPGAGEAARNPRARSATLRVAEKRA